MEIVAHRGESRGHLENTLPAVLAAVAAGADVVEIDVRLTADDVVVLLHDPTLHRLWGVPQPVAELSWAQVAQVTRAGERIPRLDEVLDGMAGSGVRLLVDVACPGTARHAWTVCREHSGGVEIGWCGDTDALRAVRALDDEAMLYLATDGLPPQELQAQIAELSPAYLNSDGSCLAPETIETAHRAGLRQSVWTIDEARTMRELVAAGADSITTNRVDRGLVVRALAADPAPLLRSGSRAAADLELTRRHEVALDLADWARRRARSRLHLSTATKVGPADHVTSTDLATEERVHQVVRAAFPDDRVVGEELGSSGTAGGSGWTWWCDPVDGTTNYAHDIGISSFSLCAARDGVVQLAAVVDHARGSIVTGRAGDGVEVDGLPLAGFADAPVVGGVVLLELDGALPWPGMAALVESLGRQGTTTRVLGSGTLAMTMTALGRTAATVIGSFSPVDHGAALLLGALTGQVLVTPDGRQHTGADLTGIPGGTPFVLGRPGTAVPLAERWARLRG